MADMTFYVVMINDRHFDPDAEVFTDLDAAIGYARQIATDLNHHPEDFEEPDPPPGNWLYYARYSTEGDSVWVLERKVVRW